MTHNETRAIPLSAGVKCPVCETGVFRQVFRTETDRYGEEVWGQQTLYICSSGEYSRCRIAYHPGHLELDEKHYAVLNGSVQSVRNQDRAKEQYETGNGKGTK